MKITTPTVAPARPRVRRARVAPVAARLPRWGWAPGALVLLAAAAPAPPPAPAGPGEGAGPWAPGAPADRVLASVTLLELVPAKDKALAAGHERAVPVQTGFFVDEQTFVTGLGGLFGASEYRVGLGRDQVTMSVVAVDPRLDLAALRPRRVDAKVRETMARWAPLDVVTASGMEAGDEGALTFVVPRREPARAEVVEVEALLAEDEFFDPRLLELGNAPIVDPEGRVLGMWRWAGAKSPWTDAEDLRAFVAGLPAIGDETDELAPPRIASSSLPRLHWEAPKGKKGGTSNAVRAAGALDERVRCGRCAGEGSETVRKVHHPGTRKQRVETVKVTCPHCKGSCLSEALDLWYEARILAAICTGADPAHERSDAVTRALEDGVRVANARNPHEFQRRLRDAAREELRDRNAVAGRSVPFLVEHDVWTRAFENATGSGLVLVEEENLRLILVHPLGRNVSGESDDAFVVGTVAGTVQHEGEVWTVVERARAVPIKRPRERTGR